MKAEIGEETWFSDRNSEFPLLVMNPGTYRQGWKQSLTDTLQANTSFISWILDKLEPKKEKVLNYVDMSIDAGTVFGEAVVSCTYRKKVTVNVPRPKFYLRTEADGPRGALFQPVLEEPEYQQVVHLCLGDYMKLLEVMKKKAGPGKGLQIRLVYADPPWGFHSTKKGERSEDECLESPNRVSKSFVRFCYVSQTFEDKLLHLIFVSSSSIGLTRSPNGTRYRSTLSS